MRLTKMSRVHSILQSDIITVASWEQRYISGLEYLFKVLKPKSLIMFYYKEYAELTDENRINTNKLCKENNVKLNQIELSFASPRNSWEITSMKLDSYNWANRKSITLDLSTMPREQIWLLCNYFIKNNLGIQYAYHKPKQYSNEWLSRDPGRPRFVYKLSGLAKIDKPTTLVILTGFDVERSKQLIRFYEPINIIIGLQKGDQYNNIIKNQEIHLKGLDRNKEIIWFEIDGYSINESLSTIEKYVNPLVEESNVILTSLGPKISSLALFKYHKKNKSTSLSYAPSNEYNKDYSSGYDSTIIDIFDYI